MGHVGINAGIYLLAKLGMTAFAEYPADEWYDAEAVEVKDGLIRAMRRPRNRFFKWADPAGRSDLVVLLGEAQPPAGKAAFCRDLIKYARGLGIERVFTFAAMATPMHPEHPSRVFAAATDHDTLAEIKNLDVKVLEDGHIGGLNGVLLGAAADIGLSGVCLLGEMPHIFHQLPFPKGSLAVLEVFRAYANLDLDLDELAQQAESVEKQLGDLLARVEDQIRERQDDDDEGESNGEEFEPEGEAEAEEKPAAKPKPKAKDTRRIDELFEQAATDRSKAFELKQELDRLELFKEYEDRFLDLFRTPGPNG
jgi:proteasome assembly chaperone (PAC2) family protein